MIKVPKAAAVIVAIGALVVVASCLMLSREHSGPTSQIQNKHRAYVIERFEGFDSSDDFRRITSIPNLVLFLDYDAYDEGSESLLQTTLRVFSRK